MPTIADGRPLGAPLPDVVLPDADGVRHGLHEVSAGRPLVVAFLCNHCPYVRHVETELAAVARDLMTRGVAVVGVMSNDVEAYPDDDLPAMRDQVARAGWTFPYLLDADQTLARTLGAACTPDLFLFDSAGRLAHRGAFDGSTPGNGVPVTGDALRRAAEAVLAGRDVPDDLPPALGCSIKWRPEHRSV